MKRTVVTMKKLPKEIVKDIQTQYGPGKFGIILALRMLDEGIVQSNLYSDHELKNIKTLDCLIGECEGAEIIE